MPQVRFTQYLRPNGKRTCIYIKVEDHWYERAMQILKDPMLSFEAEELTTGQVSLTLTHAEKGDLICEICNNTYKEVNTAVEQLIDKAYNLEQYGEPEEL